MAKIKNTREWDSLYEGRVVLHIPYSDSRTYPFSENPCPSDRGERPTCQQATQAAIKDGRAEEGNRLVSKSAMRLIPKGQEAKYRNNPRYRIKPYVEQPTDGVRIKGRKINEEWGDITVLVDGKAVANFPHSTDPRDWDGVITSKLDALEAARAFARAERDKWVEPKPDSDSKPPRDLKERELHHRQVYLRSRRRSFQRR
jgi:hypothetical protein